MILARVLNIRLRTFMSIRIFLNIITKSDSKQGFVASFKYYSYSFSLNILYTPVQYACSVNNYTFKFSISI